MSCTWVEVIVGIAGLIIGYFGGRHVGTRSHAKEQPKKP
jgi:uncharacterized protein YneF (UPF0154 family)